MKALVTILGIIFGASGLQAQDCNPNPPQSMPEIAAFSIFTENYGNGQYEFALNYGRWLICKKPTDIEGFPPGRFDLSKQYPKFIKMYTEIGLGKSDPAEREAYLDSAVALYNESFELFAETDEDKYEMYQRRGRFFLENYNYIDGGLQKAYADFEMLFELDPEKTTTLADGYYVRIVAENMSRDSGRKDNLLSMIETAMPFASPDLKTVLEDLQKKTLGSPEERIEFYKGRDDVESMKELADAYDDLNMVAERVAVLRKIHEVAPSFESAMEIAEVEKGNANYQAAADMFEEALAKAPSDNDKKELNLDIADAYASMEKLSTAKKYILEALKIDSNYGEAYLQLARIYGSAVNACTAERKLEAKDKVVYWVVLDFLNKAKSLDSSLTNTVNSQLATYEPVTPSTEDKFFTLGYEQGQKVKVDSSLDPCYSWIGETTTVR